MDSTGSHPKTAAVGLFLFGGSRLLFSFVVLAILEGIVLSGPSSRLGAGAPLQAQELGSSDPAADSRGPAALPSTEAALIDTAMEIDGRLDEAAWRRAPVASDFVQGEPVEGIPAEEGTEVWVLFDGDALYVGAYLYDSDVQNLADQLVRRDDRGSFDYFEVSLDPNSDRRTGYSFRVSAANVQGDAYLYDDRREDRAWDAVWQSKVHRKEDGWTVEMKIPLSQIRYEAADSVQSWGANFTRMRQQSREKSYFRLISRLQEGRVSQFGRLHGISIPRASRRVELRPYVLSSAHQGPAEKGDPFFDGSSLDARAGVELRYGLGAAFTLDATINPDFGQVEADPAVINLSAFETFYQERRPFFVEDARIFDFNLSGHRNNLFYSRRIGRNPQGGRPSEADFSEAPDAATILGAAKMTGRTSGGLSIGALAAVTREEVGRAFYEDRGVREQFTVEPRGRFGVLRLQQDFRDGASQVGGIVTGMYRGLPGDGTFDFLTAEAFSGGVDFEHTWNNREWAFHGFLAGSHVRGDSTALIRLQRESNHYFHRPDALYVEMDSTATSMTGAEWRLQLDKRNGEHWTGGVWVAQVTPGFEINDLGFSQSRERLDGGTRISYREIHPGDLFRGYSLSFTTYHNWSHDVLEEDPFSLAEWSRAHTSGSFNLRGNAELLNYWRLDANLRLSPDNMSRTATRGGPLMKDPGNVTAGLRLNTDRRRALSVSPGFELNRGRAGSGRSFRAGMGVQIRPSPRTEIEISPSFNTQEEGAQYVASTGILPFQPTYGRHYIFSDLERRTFSMDTRVNMTFSPSLSLQLFAQPFLSSGEYLSYKQLARAESYAFQLFEEGEYRVDEAGNVICQGGRNCLNESEGIRYLDLDGDGTVDYSFGDRDFNLRSLIGNAVIRWEYRPGSTVFLVWQHRQSAWANAGEFNLNRDLAALWDAPSDDVFMLKVNYWLGL
ncbi:MAG: DUF5916 domain-containing protein [Longimicrobiales bacterium]